MNPVRSWWNWCSESFEHMFVGVTIPILLIVATVILVTASDGDLVPQPPRADVAGVCVGATPVAVECAATAPNVVVVSTATPVPPTPTPAPRPYIVASGDTLSRICANEVSHLDAEACINQVVALNKLDGPDQLVAGQSLLLPPAPSSASTSTRRTTPTPAPPIVERAGVVTEPAAQEAVPEEDTAEEEIASEEEPAEEETAEAEEPTPRASLVAIGPAYEAPDENGSQEAQPLAEATSADGDSPDGTEETDLTPGREYTVSAGDTLMAICIAHVPDMHEDDCVEFTVLLNGLAGPDQIRAGQVLTLP